MNIDLTFQRSGTGPAGRRADRVPSLPFPAIHVFRQPSIPDEGPNTEFREKSWYNPLEAGLCLFPRKEVRNMDPTKIVALVLAAAAAVLEDVIRNNK